MGSEEIFIFNFEPLGLWVYIKMPSLCRRSVGMRRHYSLPLYGESVGIRRHYSLPLDGKGGGDFHPSLCSFQGHEG